MKYVLYTCFRNVTCADEHQGFVVPVPLRKYIPGAPEFLPYTRELPKDSTSSKAKSKAASKSTGSTEEASKKLQGLQL